MRTAVDQGSFSVFPMYVGVIPWLLPLPEATTRIPHVCGGDPVVVVAHAKLVKYSPCMWR